MNTCNIHLFNFNFIILFYFYIIFRTYYLLKFVFQAFLDIFTGKQLQCGNHFEL